MPKLFFTADNYFSHANIIKHCNRPFSSVEEMDEHMIGLWNATVQNEDEVFHLGDFSFYKNGREIFQKLNGRKHLIIGNHDSRDTLRLPWASSPKHYFELRNQGAFGKRYDIVLHHYPIEEWNGWYRGHAIHFHGHVHGKILKPNDRIRIDVGVDVFGFKPVTLEEILKV